MCNGAAAALNCLDKDVKKGGREVGDLRDALESLRRLALELKQVNAGLCDANANLERVLAQRLREMETLSLAVREGEQRRRSQAREFDHRVKNALAVVHSLAVESRRHAPTPEDFEQGLQARLATLSRSHDLLAARGWEGASLQEIVFRALMPHANGGCDEGPVRLMGDGLDVHLTPSVAVTVSLAFHELLSNAARHGALSVPEGTVELQWCLDESVANTPVVEIDWRERGGPPVRPPKRRGFGSRLMERGLRRGLSADVQMNFMPAGLECLIRLPLGKRVAVAPSPAAHPINAGLPG